jgi:hypothetical protein
MHRAVQAELARYIAGITIDHHFQTILSEGNMKPLFFILVAAAVIAGLSNCTQSTTPDNSACGAQKQDVFTYKQKDLTALIKPDYVNSFLSGEYRVFQFSKLIENVCPDQHVNVTFSFNQVKGKTGIGAAGRVAWYYLWERKVEMNRQSETSWQGSTEGIGLKQTFNEDPGWFSVIIECMVKASNDEFADYCVFYNAFDSFTITSSYAEYKKK